MDKYTDYCISELRNCLTLNYPEFEWPINEKEIKGRDLITYVDIYGENKNNRETILIQFEMHRESTLTNAIKAIYCLEGQKQFKEIKILIIHIFTPFSEKTEKLIDEDYDIPNWANGCEKKYSQYMRRTIKKENRYSARRNAYNHRLLCQYLENKGLLNSKYLTYRTIQWQSSDFPEIRKALLVLPKSKNLFPEQTPTAISSLTDQIKMIIDKWKSEE